jgi:parallel beta-helix repeat protein
MKRLFLPAAALLLLLAGCTGEGTPPFPTERPELSIPEGFELGQPLNVVQDQPVQIEGDISNYSFQNCEVWIAADGLEIADSEFINSPVSVAGRANLVFDGVIFRDLNQYERAALSLFECSHVSITNCQFVDNYIGLGVHSSSAEILANRFEGNNGHNALLIGEGSAAEVTGNYFYGSFPHAMLILNREESPQAWVDISQNFIDQSGEDAIDFEDYRGAAANVSGNVIVNTGWSALVVEYNSWGAEITLANNWIEATGIDWGLATHPLQPDEFQPGWGHGILIEDSSAVTVRNNRILAAGENGIELANSRDVLIEGNGINCARFGIGVHRYNEGSLYRPFSPLAPENANGSEATASGNVIYQAQKDYDVDAVSQLN